MIVSERVRERMDRLGISQSELARRVGVAQPTIYKLLHSAKKGSTKLHLIARELRTTPAYLSGETDNPEEDAPLPVPMPQIIMMPVTLPSEPALEQMFEAFLEIAGDGLSRAELARELAQQLPIGLSALQAPLVTQRAATVRPRVLATGDRERPR